MSAYVPVRDRILIRKYSGGGMTKGGIALPEIADAPNKGTVVAVGSGHLTQNGDTVDLEISEGDTVHFAEGYAQRVDLDGDQYFVLREADVFLVEK